MRKEEYVRIPDDYGRDAGKIFFLREADALTADRWGNKVLWLMIQNGVPMPPGMENTGLLGFFASIVGLLMSGVPLPNVDYDRDIEPLYREIFRCVEYVPVPTDPNTKRALVPGAPDIEEARTYPFLRSKLFEMHWGFTRPGGASTPTGDQTTLPADGSNTQTSES